MSIFKTTFALFTVTSLGLLGCGDNSNSDASDNADDDVVAADARTTPVDAESGPKAVTINFAANVDGVPFVCGQTYTGVGSADSAYIATDFRFYVSGVSLINEAGDMVPVLLTESNYQSDGIALLDFEDKTGACSMGSEATNKALVGTVPAGTYNGLTFTLGLPFEKNHLDATTAAPPLSEAGMFWGWRGGYKFAKIDGAVDTDNDPKTAAIGYNFHLGSTGCPGDNPTEAPTGDCVNPNRPVVEFAAFNPDTDVVSADIGTILADANVGANTVGTAPGCMSFPGDLDCVTMLPKVGLPFDGTPAGTQSLFTVVSQ